jgi:hypothetical protein
MDKLEYHKNYYHNTYKNIIANKKCFCECCQLEFASWNIYKHNKSKKHFFNSLNEEDKQYYLEEKKKDKIVKKIHRLEKLIS